MDLKTAKEIVGSSATWELLAMKKALELPIGIFLNTPEDNKRLEAVNTVLKERRKLKRLGV